MAPDLLLAIIQIGLGSAMILVGALLRRVRTAEAATVSMADIGGTVVVLGTAAILIGVAGVAGATDVIGRFAAAVTQSLIALAALAAAVRFCLLQRRRPRQAPSR